MNRQPFISILLSLLGLMFLLSAVLLVAGWLAGVLFNDRWIWSQWLSWLPALILIPAGIFWLSGAALMKPMRKHWAPGICLLVLGPLVFLYMNWRPSTDRSDDANGITFTQWTLGTVLDDEEAYARSLHEIDSDISIIEGARRIRWSRPVKEWLGPDHTPLSTGIFSVFTQLPVDQLRSIIWAEGIYAAMLIVNGPGFEDMPLRILLIDLPSDPDKNRWQIAERLEQLLAKAEFEQPDLIIGDFNMPANSVAFASLFKEYRRAWDDSGAGWGPTFPREWPIVRIDHVLTGPTVDVTSIRTIDPGIGRHQLQVFKVIKRTEVEPGHSNEVLITK